MSNWWMHSLGWLLGLDNVESIEEYRVSFAEPWAQRSPLLLLLGCAALAVLVIFFYFKLERRAHGAPRYVLLVMRAALLCLLFLILANPIQTVTTYSRPDPMLYVLFDGTESMAIEDELPEDERQRIEEAVKFNAATGQPVNGTAGDSATASGDKPSRIDYVRALVRREEPNPLKDLDEKFRLKLFVLDKPDGVRQIQPSREPGGELDLVYVAEQLQPLGEVTALGEALEDLYQRHSTNHLRGLVVVSDFAKNTGPELIGSRTSPVAKLAVPIYAVGVGAEHADDLAVAISTDPGMKKAESTTIRVTLRQTGQGFTGREVSVVLKEKKLSDNQPSGDEEGKTLDTKEVTLEQGTTIVEFPYTPQETGRFEFSAEVEPLAEETVTANNRALREAPISDDFLRLMYVAHEPNWEWRFIKEVFHRDKLVGLRGFRTYLRSSDPKVRRTNPLFLPTLTPPRSEFFANDVIFLGDVPESLLSSRFCEMVKEFVGTFGGGLVVMSGPRFGPGQLDGTLLADLLPVKVDPGARPRDEREFRMQLAPFTVQEDFMLLGANEALTRKAWENMGLLPWYQPVLRVHPMAQVLAYHPTDTCVDGKTPQPLIAVRKYGKGEVIYLAFDETWRLRRMYGEEHYRKFWGQMIYRLGLRRDLGSQKRFVATTDRQRYRVDDDVLVAVEAFDEDFTPITEDDVPQQQLSGELVVIGASGEPESRQDVTVPFAGEGRFEARLPALEAGEHRLRVRDPITDQYSEVIFHVAGVKVELQSAVRDAVLQRQVAQESGGKTYDLVTAVQLADDIDVTTKLEFDRTVTPLWSTPLCFIVIVGLMLGEWLIRKWVNLA